MIYPSVVNETNRLRTVFLGLADDFGGTPKEEEVYDPKSLEHVRAGTFPSQASITRELAQLEAVLNKYDVQILRPHNISGVNQVFARDIAFVIDSTLVIPNIIQNRREEASGVNPLLDYLPKENVVVAAPGIRIEGGDVMPWNEAIFVGYAEDEDFKKYKVARTNKAGVEFLKQQFPHRKVYSFELNKSDVVAHDNSLHLDCCFQPIGKDQAIIYKAGFRHKKDADFLINYFGREKVIEISQQEMYDMNSNIFSISPEVIISCHSFKRLNAELARRGFTVEKIDYDEIAKMEGLLRCSTMPIVRD